MPLAGDLDVGLVSELELFWEEGIALIDVLLLIPRL